MQEVSTYTKMEPTDKVIETNKFIQLLQDTTEDKDTHWSSKKKAEHYGVQINPLKELFSAYYMTPTQLKDGQNKIVSKNNQKFVNLVKSIPMVNWVFFMMEIIITMQIFLINLCKRLQGNIKLK